MTPSGKPELLCVFPSDAAASVSGGSRLGALLGLGWHGSTLLSLNKQGSVPAPPLHHIQLIGYCYCHPRYSLYQYVLHSSTST
jgi:hypothetical protein